MLLTKLRIVEAVAVVGVAVVVGTATLVEKERAVGAPPQARREEPAARPADARAPAGDPGGCVPRRAHVRRAPDREPAGDQFVIVPLRAHILTAPDLELADCKLSEADVVRVIGRVNAIWHKAGIHFGLESVVREPAAQRERFRLTAEQNRGEVGVSALKMLLPRSTREFDGFHVYFFHELPFNSLSFGDDSVIAQEVARVNPVEGGCDDPIARVTAHALGNELGLPNRAEPGNLMGNGTSGMALDADQAGWALKVARTVPGALTVSTARRAAESADSKKDAATARRLRSWLAEIPGARDEEAKRRGTPDRPPTP
jgi:hypothetical protein